MRQCEVEGKVFPSVTAWWTLIQPHISYPYRLHVHWLDESMYEHTTPVSMTPIHVEMEVQWGTTQKKKDIAFCSQWAPLKTALLRASSRRPLAGHWRGRMTEHSAETPPPLLPFPNNRLLKFEKSQKLQEIRCHSEFFLKSPENKDFRFLNCLCFFKLLFCFFFLFLQLVKKYEVSRTTLAAWAKAGKG